VDTSSHHSQRPAPRARLLDTAARLFYIDGIRAVGVDRLVAEANVTRATFYRHFASKDELVTTYIQSRDQELRTRFEAVTQMITDPADLLRAVAIDIAQTICGEAFRGCPFINAAVEFPDPNSPIHQAVNSHRTWFHDTLLSLFIALAHPEPHHAARRLILLRDGAMIGGYLGAPDESIKALNTGLEKLIDEAYHPTGDRSGQHRSPPPTHPSTTSTSPVTALDLGSVTANPGRGRRRSTKPPTPPH
jgi:AcrR family transcriptional regulator